jgi:hypothetical protein
MARSRGSSAASPNSTRQPPNPHPGTIAPPEPARSVHGADRDRALAEVRGGDDAAGAVGYPEAPVSTGMPSTYSSPSGSGRHGRTALGSRARQGP